NGAEQGAIAVAFISAEADRPAFSGETVEGAPVFVQVFYGKVSGLKGCSKIVIEIGKRLRGDHGTVSVSGAQHGAAMAGAQISGRPEQQSSIRKRMRPVS